MRRFTKIILSLVCAVGLFTARANAQLFLEDGKKVLSVSGGEHTNGTLLIHNTSAEPADIKVYWEDFEYKPPYEGTKNFLPAGTAPASASQWVTFSPQVFTMPGFGQQKVEYTVSVPPTITEGHYGVLFFERSSDALKNEAGVSLVTRVGCLFFVEPKNKDKKAVLDDVKISGSNLTASFVNQGNVILIPKTTYYVMQAGGLVALRGEHRKLYVPPGKAGILTIALGNQLKAGQYSLVVNCDLEDGDVAVKEIGLSVDESGQITITSSQD